MPEVKSKEQGISAELEKLRDETEFVSELLMHAYVSYLFLRPIIADRSLAARMEEDGKAEGFNQIGESLYWSFIQQLVKIWDDRDSQDRNVSIQKILNQAVDYRIVAELEKLNSRWTTPHGELPDPEIVKEIRQREVMESREDFRHRFDAVLRRGNEILRSQELIAYRKARNKLVAHTETRRLNGKLKRFDIKSLRLKFGDERKVLSATVEIVHELQCLIQGIDVSWGSLRELYVGDVCTCWGIEALDEKCP